MPQKKLPNQGFDITCTHARVSNALYRYFGPRGPLSNDAPSSLTSANVEVIGQSRSEGLEMRLEMRYIRHVLQDSNEQWPTAQKRESYPKFTTVQTSHKV